MTFGTGKRGALQELYKNIKKTWVNYYYYYYKFHNYPGYPRHRSVFQRGPASICCINKIIFMYALFNTTSTQNSNFHNNL